MITNAAVEKESASETNLSLIRRFSRRLQSSGVVRRAKSHRYSERPLSNFKKKKSALAKLKRRTDIERLKKLGLIGDGRNKKPN